MPKVVLPDLALVVCQADQADRADQGLQGFPANQDAPARGRLLGGQAGRPQHFDL